MMTFIVLTLSFTVAILLAMGLSFVVMMNPKVMKWYMNYMFKSMKRFDELAEDQLEDEL